MSRKKIYIYSGLALLIFIAWLNTASSEKNAAFSESVKIALRDAGNQLLLSNQDSTSLILPVIDLEKSKYRLSFQKELSFEPSDLVSFVDSSFTKSKLPNNYLVEVIQCSDEEVAYSYKISAEEESTIIPCAGRFLPESCYTIEVKFTDKASSIISKMLLLYLLFFILSLFLLDFLISKRKQQAVMKNGNEKYSEIGSFQFYPDQNKLVKKSIEISLSKKECELLEIFVANPNQIIKRDELEKRVWEDNGVFVGRSLDTYISKLRKILKEDTSIKLTNVHGVGYKLEVLK
jgi:hypothetical protein